MSYAAKRKPDQELVASGRAGSKCVIGKTIFGATGRLSICARLAFYHLEGT